MDKNAAPEVSKRRALGKGLEALLPRLHTSPAIEAARQPDSSGTSPGLPLEVPLDSIQRNPFQTRTQFDDKQLVELAASISAAGVVQPILVRPLPEGRYQLIAGERRWLASKIAKKTTIPAIVRRVSDGQAMDMTIIENLQRADLNPMEQARAFDRLGREFHLTQEQIAIRTGKDRATVANFLRMLRLPTWVQERVESGELSFGHARCLLSLENPEAMLQAAQKVLALSMSVRQTETYVQGLVSPEKKGEKERTLKEPLDPNVREARDLLQRALGLRVRIEDRKGRGRVIIEYSGLEDFDGLLDTIAGR